MKIIFFTRDCQIVLHEHEFSKFDVKIFLNSERPFLSKFRCSLLDLSREVVSAVILKITTSSVWNKHFDNSCRCFWGMAVLISFMRWFLIEAYSGILLIRRRIIAHFYVTKRSDHSAELCTYYIIRFHNSSEWTTMSCFFKIMRIYSEICNTVVAVFELVSMFTV